MQQTNPAPLLVSDRLLAHAENDLNDLVANIVEPETRYYLKDTVAASLERLGHDQHVIEAVVTRFFKRTLQ